MKNISLRKIIDKIFFNFPLTLFVIGILFFIVRTIILYPDEKIKLEKLKVEFNKIRSPLKSNVSHEEVHCFPDKTSIDIDYTTLSTDYKIQEYYDSVLTINGWKLTSKEKLLDWGHDLGGYLYRYKKYDMEFSIQYATDRKEYGWAYGIFLK